MKLTIDIDENLYTRLFDNGECDAVDMLKACASIRKGTPLPKGHGRLIDADSVNNIVRPIECSDCEWAVTGETVKRLIYDVFDKASTIIEADNERSE